MVETVLLRARGPYSLALSMSEPPCPSRRRHGRVLELVFRTPEGLAHALVRQAADGTLEARVEAGRPEEAVAALRDLLGLDRDPEPFLRAVAGDPLLGPATRRLRGYRPLALGSAAQGLLSGVCGQLVTTREARRSEAAAVRRVGTRHAGLVLPLDAAQLRRLAPIDLCAGGLAERRAVDLVRAARTLDLDGFPALDTAEIVRRITAHRGLGPWTAGVVALALGRWDQGLVGDLGIIRLMAVRDGRVPTTEETAALLDRYAPWQGLASAYLLKGVPDARIAAPPGALAAARRSAGGAVRTGVAGAPRRSRGPGPART